MELLDQMKELAAKYNYFMINEIPENVLVDKYFAENFQYEKNRFNNVNIPEGLLKCENIIFGVFAEVRQQLKSITKEHELFHIDNFKILIYSEKANCLLQLLKNNKDKYYLHPIYEVLNKLQINTSYEQRKPFINEIFEPNYIGVFTEKKINDWVEYCNQYINALQLCEDKIHSEKNANELIIQNTIDSLPYAKVSKYHNTTDIETKLFRMRFNLLNNGAYLINQIEFKGSLNDIISLQL